jgi:pyocin large subunit-like protein
MSGLSAKGFPEIRQKRLMKAMILTSVLIGLWGLLGWFSAVSWAFPSDLAKSNFTGDSNSAFSRQADIGFASHQKLIAHYEKHGREFGSITIEEYLARAKSLRDRPLGGSVLEMVRPDGTISRFDRATGDFIAFNPKRVIKTFFRPTAGEAYFQRQGQR